MDLVMVNGHVACLKTRLSYLLAPLLSMAHVTTSVLGSFEPHSDDQRFFALRDKRYLVATETVEHYLARGVSVIVDGTFALPRWRDAIYTAAARYRVCELVAVTCVCSRRETIEQRLAYRRRTPSAPDARANDIAAYDGSVRTFVPLDNDWLPDGRGISHIVFDSCTFEVAALRSEGNLCGRVVGLLKELAQSRILGRPLRGRTLSGPTSAGPCDGAISVPRRFVALEGIGGSGKTTLATRLAGAIAIRPSVTNVQIINEFSSSLLGEFLRRRLAAAHDFRIRALRGPSHLDSLLVIADMVCRIRTVSTCPSGTVGVFDGFSMSWTAHTLALLPDRSDSQLIGVVALAAKVLCQQIPPLPGPVFTVLLDVPPDVAAKRVEDRLGKALDGEQRDFLVSLRSAFNELADRGNVGMRIDATQAIDVVTQEVLETLSSFLSEV